MLFTCRLLCSWANLDESWYGNILDFKRFFKSICHGREVLINPILLSKIKFQSINEMLALNNLSSSCVDSMEFSNSLSLSHYLSIIHCSQQVLWVQSQVESYQRLKKMVLDASLLNTQHNKVRIKGKVFDLLLPISHCWLANTSVTMCWSP